MSDLEQELRFAVLWSGLLMLALTVGLLAGDVERMRRAMYPRLVAGVGYKNQAQEEPPASEPAGGEELPPGAA